VQERYEANTQQAIDAGVFGAPSFVVDGELFWGQDRLDFVERALAAKAALGHRFFEILRLKPRRLHHG
jgi:protein-disulfide isomerase